MGSHEPPVLLGAGHHCWVEISCLSVALPKPVELLRKLQFKLGTPEGCRRLTSWGLEAYFLSRRDEGIAWGVKLEDRARGTEQCASSWVH